VIVEYFFQLASGMGTWLFGLLPDTSAATNLVVQSNNAFAPIMAGAASLGAWMPWGTLGLVFPIVIGFYIGAFLVKVLRQLFTHVPVFGGSG